MTKKSFQNGQFAIFRPTANLNTHTVTGLIGNGTINLWSLSVPAAVWGISVCYWLPDCGSWRLRAPKYSSKPLCGCESTLRRRHWSSMVLWPTGSGPGVRLISCSFTTVMLTTKFAHPQRKLQTSMLTPRSVRHSCLLMSPCTPSWNYSWGYWGRAQSDSQQSR